MLVNCLACGGDAHGTPGVYHAYGLKPSFCGFCRGLGKVHDYKQFIIGEPQPKKRKHKQTTKTQVAMIVLLFMGGVFASIAVLLQ